MIYYTDGFCLLKNPSPKGGGYTVTDADGEVLEHYTIDKVGFTNNEAELLGVCKAIEIAGKQDVVVTDSQIVLGWVLRKMAKKRTDLNPLLEKAYNTMVEKEVYLAWQPRDANLAGHFNEDEGLDKPVQPGFIEL